MDPSSTKLKRGAAWETEQSSVSASSHPPSKKRRRPSPENDELTSGRPAVPRPSHPDPRRTAARPVRKRKSSTLSEAPDELSADYASLKPRTRHVSQATIRTRWTTLPAPAQSQIRSLLLAAKRSVLASHPTEQRRTEADAAISILIRRLEKQLPRMPFPPKTKAGSFDAARLSEGCRGLEGALTAVMQDVALLEAEIEREEAALERERTELKRLERDARREEERRRREVFKIHPLLQLSDDLEDEDIDDGAESIGLITTKRSLASARQPLFDNPDPELDSLLKQLGSHMESMQSNHAQVTGLSDATAGAQATLEDALGGIMTGR
ncbi:CENP-Q, a CENPA-CAD centromere complex subunit-domain-containing protein [Cryomyces antarcticus]